MSEGTFIAHVYTSDALIPIPDATIIVSQGRNLLATRLSDISGITQAVTISTPDESASLEPGQQTPYAVVNVTVDHPDYGRIEANNVQIFPGVVTEQNFELIPFSELPESWSSTEYFNTPAQNL